MPHILVFLSEGGDILRAYTLLPLCGNVRYFWRFFNLGGSLLTRRPAFFVAHFEALGVFPKKPLTKRSFFSIIKGLIFRGSLYEY